MPIFMLHFSCTPSRHASSSNEERWTADSCVIAAGLEQAEERARKLIGHHNYQAGELIAFSEVKEQQVASLPELESTLYLKAQVKNGQSVLFSQWPSR